MAATDRRPLSGQARPVADIGKWLQTGGLGGTTMWHPHHFGHQIMEPTPDQKWYSDTGAERGVHGRCPYATVESCPRFYQSLSLLGDAGSTTIPEAEDARLLAFWRKSDLWPRTLEQSTSISGGEPGNPSLFCLFCPEVTFDRFGYFATYLSQYADEIDMGVAHERLAAEGASANDPRWTWQSATAQHFTDCSLHAVLKNRPQPLVSASMTAKTQILLCPRFELGPGSGDMWVLETPVQSGDFVVRDDTILTIENDLASLELPSPMSGRIVNVLVNIGDKVTGNTPIIEIEPQDNLFRDDLGRPGGQTAQNVPTPNTVFLVHGHNEAMREMSARLLERLGLTAIILNEQVSGSDTVIEKLERYASVHFAVVLMTGDDVGGMKSPANQILQDRARQNVLLELGYFMGKIGRRKVCVLYERGVELPSDYYGVVYIEIDKTGAWRYTLAKELKQAGLQVDLNRL
jgi:predicted nucleotide-binding protein